MKTPHPMPEADRAVVGGSPTGNSREPRARIHMATQVAIAALVIASFSRIAVALGFPPIINFFHFPLVILFVLAVQWAKVQDRRVAPAQRWLGVLLVGSVASWLGGGGTVLSPF